MKKWNLPEKIQSCAPTVSKQKQHPFTPQNIKYNKSHSQFTCLYNMYISVQIHLLSQLLFPANTLHILLLLILQRWGRTPDSELADWDMIAYQRPRAPTKVSISPSSTLTHCGAAAAAAARPEQGSYERQRRTEKGQLTGAGLTYY